MRNDRLALSLALLIVLTAAAPRTALAASPGVWQGLGGAAGTSASNGNPGYVAAAVDPDTHTIYVAFADAAHAGKATVVKYDRLSGWQVVGTPGFSAGQVKSISLVVYQQTPFVSFVVDDWTTTSRSR